MAGSVNKVIIIGNLGADPEIRHTNDGRIVAKMSIATSESWKTKDGEKREKTEWHRVVVFNEPLAKLCEQYLKKGAKVYIEGSLATKKWQDKSGADRYTTEIVLESYRGAMTMLGGGGKADGPRADYDDAPASGGSYANKDVAKPAAGDYGLHDDNIPF